MRAYDADRPLSERLTDLSAMSNGFDTLFRDYLSPFTFVGDTPQGDELAWPISLARWTELLHHHAHDLLYNVLLPELESHGFFIIPIKDALLIDGNWVRSYFKEQIYPLLTPLAVDPGRPFPYISSDSLNLLVELEQAVQCEVLVVAFD